jgi:hypothetical protein
MRPDTSGEFEDLMPATCENLKVGCRASRGTNPSNISYLHPDFSRTQLNGV